MPPRPYTPSVPASQTSPQTSSGIPQASFRGTGIGDRVTNTQRLPSGVTSYSNTPHSAQPLPADSITREALQARIGHLLHTQAPRFDERALSGLAGE